jgi:excinuclease ABC subunit C
VDAGLRRAIGALPRDPGVYRFRDASDAVLYIGRAADLRGRVASYWSHLGDRPHLRRMVAAVGRIEAVVCASRHEAAWLERNLLEERMAPWNRTAGGQESPVVIALDPGPERPGLRVLHTSDEIPETARRFGPYLGGGQVRAAVAGLHRVRPLAHTGADLAGTAGAMAATRGVGADDRDALVSALTAVLGREAAAVARAGADLEALRDRAAAAEAYELATRIQAELVGLHWIAAPQRVTVLEGEEAEVHGWAGGALVSFAIRGGRMCRWDSHRCGRAEAEERLARTPAAWRDFARRNADLAAAVDAPAILRP